MPRERARVGRRRRRSRGTEKGDVTGRMVKRLRGCRRGVGDESCVVLCARVLAYERKDLVTRVWRCGLRWL